MFWVNAPFEVLFWADTAMSISSVTSAGACSEVLKRLGSRRPLASEIRVMPRSPVLRLAGTLPSSFTARLPAFSTLPRGTRSGVMDGLKRAKLAGSARSANRLPPACGRGALSPWPNKGDATGTWLMQLPSSTELTQLAPAAGCGTLTWMREALPLAMPESCGTKL